MIMACSVLHNIAMQNGVPLPPMPPPEAVRPGAAEPAEPHLMGPANRRAHNVQQQLIARF